MPVCFGSVIFLSGCLCLRGCLADRLDECLGICVGWVGAGLVWGPCLGNELGALPVSQNAEQAVGLCKHRHTHAQREGSC